MDGYAPAYVAHNVPYLVISGLGSAERSHADIKVAGVHITSDMPPVDSEIAEVLTRNFKDSDASSISWNSRTSGGRKKFRVKIVGRVIEQTRQLLLASVTESLIGIRFASA